MLSSHPESLRITRGRTIFATMPRGNPESRLRTQNVLRLRLIPNSYTIRTLAQFVIERISIPPRSLTDPRSFSWLVFPKIWKSRLAAAFRTITSELTIICADYRSDLCRSRVFFFLKCRLSRRPYTCMHVWTIDLIRPRFRIDMHAI